MADAAYNYGPGNRKESNEAEQKQENGRKHRIRPGHRIHVLTIRQTRTPHHGPQVHRYPTRVIDLESRMALELFENATIGTHRAFKTSEPLSPTGP
jgi:hypothetical protein